jgi:nickel/cobalt transporter (NicO) family protein
LDLIRSELYQLWAWSVDVQRMIYGTVADVLRRHAKTGDWSPVLVLAPWAIVLGAVHALTPGHSKTVLAIFVAGSRASIWPALRSAWLLAFTHITVSVLIALLSLPLVSLARDEIGRAPLLEVISRGLLGMVGLSFIISAIRGAQNTPATSMATALPSLPG